MGVVRDIFAGSDGKVDEQALVSVLGFLLGCFYQGWSVIKLQQPFDAGGFGMFVGALVGGSCAGFGLRSAFAGGSIPIPVPKGGGYDNPN